MKISPVLRRVALAAAAIGVAVPALAADVTFVMRNSHPYAVEVELYSTSRPHSWPGGDEVYLLDDGEAQTMSLACEEGEQICYGAWVSGDEGTYWGVGPGNEDTCDDCCVICAGGMTEEIDLVE